MRTTTTTREQVIADTEAAHLTEMPEGGASREPGKVRLNAGLRDELRALARKLVRPRAEAAARDEAYRRAAPGVADAIERVFATAHMEVLARYGLTVEQHGFKVVAPDRPGDVVEFKFDDGEALQVPYNRYCSYSGQTGRIFAVSEEVHAAVRAWATAQAVYEKVRDARLQAYDAVINTARTLGQVVDVWPEAAQLEVPNRPLVLLSDATLELIRTDVAERDAPVA